MGADRLVLVGLSTLLLSSLSVGCRQDAFAQTAVDARVQRSHPTLADLSTTPESNLTEGATAADVQQQLCTNGFSTYSSSSLDEAVYSHAAKPQQHKNLWPLDKRDWWTLAVATVAIFVAAGGGIGGGGVLVPLYASLLGFPAKYAVALSNFTIVGGATANLLFNIGRRHSFKSRPLIDWDLILVMEPATILGALIGGYLNKISPAWIAATLLALLITAITWKLATRAYITWHRESEALAKADLGAQGLVSDVEQPLLTEHEQEAVRQEGFEPALPAGRAIAPVSIPRKSFSDDYEHHEHHAYSPMAYSAVGSFAARPESPVSRPRRASNSDSDAAQDGLSEQTRQALLATGQSRLASQLSDVPELGDLHAGGDASDDELQQPDSPELTLHRLSQGRQQGSTEGSSGQLPLSSTSQQNGLPHSQQLENSTDGMGVQGGRPSTPQEKHLQQLLAKESTQVPPFKLGVLLLLFAGVLVTDLGKNYVQCNSLSYWAIVLSIIPFILLITLAVRSYLVKKFSEQAEAGYSWQEGDIQWSPRNSLVYPAVSSLAGLVAGMFGVGGGIVKGPLMLEMGVLPDVAAATSATMILFTSASASLVYLSFGGIAVDYSIAVLVLGFVVTLAGQGSTYWLMSKLQRRSIVIIAMASLMVLATLVMYFESVGTFLDALHHHKLTQRGYICTRH